MRPDGVVCIACSIFRREIRSMASEPGMPAQTFFLPSMLHMAPDQLEERLDSLLARTGTRPVLLLFGDCCPHMSDYERRPGTARVEGVNCVEILLGSAKYRQLRAEGVFFVLPGWVGRWREIFEHHLGLHGEIARDFMNDMHTRLVYLDTGLEKVPDEVLREMAQYTGLPFEVVPVSLEGLRRQIQDGIERTDHAR